MEDFINFILGFLSLSVDRLAERTGESPVMIICSTPLLLLLATRIIFGQQAFKLIFRLLFAGVLGLMVYIFMVETSPLASTLAIAVPAAYLLLLEKRAPIATKIFKADRFLAFSNLVGLTVGILLGVVLVFGLNWIGWQLPAGFWLDRFVEFGAFITPVVCFGVGYVAGAKFSLLSLREHPKSLILVSSVLAATVVLGAWYYFNYREFQTRVVAALADEYDDPEVVLDTLLLSETGYRGAWGHFILSARGTTSVTLVDEDYEIPEGAFSTLINWGKRLLIYIGSIVLMRKGLYSILLERIKTGKLTGAGFWAYIESLFNDDDDEPADRGKMRSQK